MWIRSETAYVNLNNVSYVFDDDKTALIITFTNGTTLTIYDKTYICNVKKELNKLL